MIFPIIRVHPSTSDDTHYTEVLHAVQWDEITLSEWQSYPDCLQHLAKGKEHMKTIQLTDKLYNALENGESITIRYVFGIVVDDSRSPHTILAQILVKLEEALEKSEKCEWVGLTEEEIYKLSKGAVLHQQNQIESFAKRVEAKLKEKNS